VIQAVIFDFGRVISAQKPPALFQRYEAELGLPPGRLNQIMFGSPAWQDTLLGRKTLDEYWRETGPALGLHTAEEIDHFRQRYFGDETINPGVLDLIHSLHGRYKLAVLSNSPPRLAKWLDDWDILYLFDVVVCSGDEGVAKPDPAIFTRTLARLAVRPEEAVFVDDTRGHVEAARQLGVHGILFTSAEALKRDLDGLLPSPG
jgi:putative hydrolase of the HAD superfamily